MKCKNCDYVSIMLDPRDDERIRIVCSSLGTATSIPAPSGWEEQDVLPDCEFDLGQSNTYCQGKAAITAPEEGEADG